MAFSKSYRLERVYFERLKSMIDILKPYLNEETDEKLRAILENSIDDNGAILLLYRNLGEAWAELSELIKKADEKIEQTKEEAEKYHDELNERIDEVNNYIMVIIRNLEETKQDKLTPGEGITIDENNVISAPKELYPIELTLNPVTSEPSIDKTYQQIKAAYESGKLPIMYNLYKEDDPEEPFYQYKLFYFDSDEAYDGMTFYEMKNDYLLSGISGDPMSMFTKARKQIVIIEPDDTITRTQSSMPITSSRTTVSTEEAGNTITLKTKFSDIRTAFFGVGVLIRTGPITNYVNQEVIEMGFDETNHVYYAKTIDKTYTTNDAINGYAVYTRT